LLLAGAYHDNPRRRRRSRSARQGRPHGAPRCTIRVQRSGPSRSSRWSLRSAGL